MLKPTHKLEEFMFLQFRTVKPLLADVCAIYYPHLSKATILEKARNHEFPFMCIRLDDSQKAPYFVDLFELAKVFEEEYRKMFDDFENVKRQRTKVTS
jgi:hypothetical protein